MQKHLSTTGMLLPLQQLLLLTMPAGHHKLLHNLRHNKGVTQPAHAAAIHPADSCVMC